MKPKFLLIVSQFNAFITDSLLQGALKELHHHQIPQDHIHIIKVPGACEIPVVAKKGAESGHFDAIITLGAVIRGDTPHFDYVCEMVSQGILHVSLAYTLPVIFGVLTTDTTEQALARSSSTHNKGAEAASAALQMVEAIKKLPT